MRAAPAGAPRPLSASDGTGGAASVFPQWTRIDPTQDLELGQCVLSCCVTRKSGLERAWRAAGRCTRSAYPTVGLLVWSGLLAPSLREQACPSNKPVERKVR